MSKIPVSGVNTGTDSILVYHKTYFNRVSELEEKGKVICNICMYAYMYVQKQLNKHNSIPPVLQAVQSMQLDLEVYLYQLIVIN